MIGETYENEHGATITVDSNNYELSTKLQCGMVNVTWWNGNKDVYDSAYLTEKHGWYPLGYFKSLADK